MSLRYTTFGNFPAVGDLAYVGNYSDGFHIAITILIAPCVCEDTFEVDSLRSDGIYIEAMQVTLGVQSYIIIQRLLQ